MSLKVRAGEARLPKGSPEKTMKVRTVGWLALAAVMLSSVSVWSLTKPWPQGEPKDEPKVASSKQTTSKAADDGTRFRSEGALVLEGRVGHARLAAERPGETYALIDVRANDSDSTLSPEPLELAIVIDKSGSMKGKRLSNALAAARTAIDRMRDGDVVSIVAYDTRSDVVAPPTVIDSGSRRRLASAVDEIRASGDTCISCGLDTAVEQLRSRGGSVERILLLSDGEATAGVRDVEGFRRIAESVRRMGASVTSIGVDVEYNERVLAALAQESNGRHYFVEEPSALSRIFDEELAALVRTAAADVELALEPARGVEVLEIVDRSFRRDAGRIVVPLGTLSGGEVKTVLARVSVPRGAEGKRPLAEVRLSYRDFASGTHGEQTGDLALRLVDDAAQVAELDPLVAARLERSATAATLTDANRLFAEGQVSEAEKKLADRRASLDKERSRSIAAAPKALQGGLDADFNRQRAALESASSGFATPPPAAGAAPAETRAGRAQVRKNQETAVGLAF
jgi:Ca-activated chloride channel family protein